MKRFIRTNLLLLCLLLATFVAKSQSPTASALGFNVFLENGATMTNNETEGPMAMGGDLTISGSYQVATNYTGNYMVGGATIGLLVGGRVNYSGGSSFAVNKNTYVKIGNPTGSTVWYKDNNNAYSPIRITPTTDYNSAPRINLSVSSNDAGNLGSGGVSATNNPVFQSGLIDFTAAFNTMRATATCMGALADNANITNSGGTPIPHSGFAAYTQVKLNLHAGMNVLNLNGSDLNNISDFIYNNAPSASQYLVVNVNAPGTFNWSVCNSSGSFNGITGCAYIIYNFYNTTTLNIQSGAAIEGTLYAPFANVVKTANSSNVEGQIIAKSYTHNGGENHYAVFAPAVCTSSPTVAAFTTNTSAQCLTGNAYVFTNGSTGSSLTYSWNFGDATSSTVTSPTHVYSAAGTYTVTLTATGTAGTNATSAVVTVNAVPSAISGAGIVCMSNPVTLTNSVAGGTWSSSNTSTAAVGASSGIVSGVANGTAVITYTLAGGCYTTKTITVSPTPATPGGPQQLCMGAGGTTFTDATTSGTWASSNSSIATVGSASGLVAGVALGTASISYIMASGCYAVIPVTVNPMPAAITGAGSLCSGQTLQLASTTSGGSWSTSNSSVALIGSSTGLVTGSNGGTSTISYTIQPGSCAVAAVVTVGALPAFITGNTTVCAGASSTLVNGTTGGTWYSSNTAIATVGAASGVVAGVSAGTAAISYALGTGCARVVTVTVNAQPNVSTSANVAICASASTVLTASGASSYSWSTASGLSCTNCANPTATPATTTTYTVTGTGGGCSNTATVTVSVNALPTISAGANVAICTGGSTTLTATGGASYTWTAASSLSCTSCSSPVATPATTTTYTVTGRNGNNCANTATVTVSVNGTPAAITGAANVCAGLSTTLGCGTTGGTWTSTNTTVATVAASTGIVSGLAAGTTLISYTASSGCYATKVITVNPALSASAAAVNVLCNGSANGSVNLTVSGGTSSYSYSWSNGATTQNIAGLVAGNYSVQITDAKGCIATASASIAQPSALAATGAATNVSCNGGSNGAITLSVSGGTTAYAYSWSNGATTQNVSGLGAGTYSVAITDANGCTAAVTKTITAPAALVASGTATNVSCNGGNNGAILLSVSGGTTAYTYSWSNGATTQSVSGLVAGTYSVAITDANGCSAYVTKTITAPVALVASGTATNVSCNGGSNGAINLSISGGTGAYTYSWSNGATTQNVSGLVAGTYSVAITDANGCSASVTKTITAPAALAASGTATNVSCNGGNNGAITLSISGGTTAYTYSWSNGATTQNVSGLGAGTYSVAITDANGCTASVTKTITAPASLVVSGTAANVSCNGGNNGAITLSVSGGTTAYTYSWSNGATTQSVSGLVAGTYSVAITDANGCSAYVTKTITAPAALTAPATAINASCNGGMGSINLTVAGGNAPYSYSWSNGANTEDLTSLAAGTYSVAVTDANGCTATETKTITQPAVLTSSAVATNVACFAGHTGAIDLTVSGGSASYSYSWSNGAHTEDISGLTSGTYNVTITDNHGCTGTLSKTITQPVIMSFTTSSTNVLCNGGNTGTMSIAVVGGVAPYTYLWSTGATTSNISALIAGTYSVAVTDANGCSRTETRTISQPAPLAASAVATSATCYGSNSGSIDLTVTSGTTDYTYNWSNGASTQDITGVTAGTYNVLVTDAHGCTTTATATVTEPTNLTAAATTTNALCSSCSNGTASLTVSGGTPSYTYLWSNGATTKDVAGLTAGTYSVVVTDAHGCATTQTVVITAPAPLTAVAATTNVSCSGSNNGSIHLAVTGGTAPYTYAWSNGATTADLSGIAAGSYSVTVTDANGYSVTTSATISHPSELTTDAATTNVACHGAAGGAINITVAGGTAPYTYSWSNGATTEDVAGLTADTYYLTVTDAHGCTDNHAYTISEPAAIQLTGATNHVVCGCTEGMGIIYLDVTGGTGDYTYLWSNGATTKNDSALWTGTYSVTVTDGHGCTATGAYAVISPVALHISSTVANASCNGSHNGTIALFVTDGVAPYSYSWSTGATTSSVGGLGAGGL